MQGQEKVGGPTDGGSAAGLPVSSQHFTWICKNAFLTNFRRRLGQSAGTAGWALLPKPWNTIGGSIATAEKEFSLSRRISIYPWPASGGTIIIWIIRTKHR